ncbi:preprotein translocase subunit YajC [Paenibacillus sp. L3-i20]|uniref:preprotein translocase subunit YajC n=1 Tax=Paenibacillus sp. L3-i20 TaxID=2905833 RepID=UPI001EDE10FB|nr:preprotein translocase subunit YajC [Paenibacillus sp. L3-i20]GKU75694.1 preprotein translocase subunit YajC [Paenibacillus sp. L3-i20]
MSILQAAEPATGAAGIFNMIWPFILMFAVFYFLLIRPQQKKQKQRTAMLNQIKKGDKITTIGGLHGTVVELADDTVVIRVNDTTKMTFERSAVNAISASAPAATE